MRMVVLVVCILSMAGCFAPAILGVKSYQSGDTKIDFITGVDFGLGMNGIDHVDDNRSIAPTQGANLGKGRKD